MHRLAVGRPHWRRSLPLLAILLGAADGCASHRAVTRPDASPPFSRQRNATIGTDKASAPPGQTIPPAGLGVDLI
jgi:hypothetical protein